MIWFEHTEVVGWEAAIRGMRNPMNSWERSDSQLCKSVDGFEDCRVGVHGSCPRGDEGYFKEDIFCVGKNDFELMQRLARAGTDHRKFMRMIVVYVDVTAPLYWISELDTYKVGTVRNSCSFMHKGVSRPFTIRDFSVFDERIYDVLSKPEKTVYKMTYPYETSDFKRVEIENGRTYRVYRNGRVVKEKFEYTDTYGRTRHFEEKEVSVFQNKGGYFYIRKSGRGSGTILLHRLVAFAWLGDGGSKMQVNHKNGNKGDNSVENLEWVTARENMQHAIGHGLYKNLSSLRSRYISWKSSASVIPASKRMEFYSDVHSGLHYQKLTEKYGITKRQAYNSKWTMEHSEYEELFQMCYTWERVLNTMNAMREEYLETKDPNIFQAIRCLLPSGYMQRSTYMLNYEVLANIYRARRNHKLTEWREFCRWIETLPYSELITGGAE